MIRPSGERGAPGAPPRKDAAPLRPALTIRDRLRHTPGLPLYLGLLLLAPVLLFAGWLALSEGFASVDNGILINDWGTVEVADSRWPGVQPGDRVVDVRMHGKRIHAPYRMPEPGLVSITFRRGEREWEAQAEAVPWQVRYQAATGVRLVTGALLLLIGLASFLVKPGPRASWLFLLFCYSLAILSLLFFRHDRVTYALQFFTMAAAGGLGLHLFTEFPRPVPWLARGKAAILFYLPAILLPPAAFAIVFDPPEPWRRIAVTADTLLWFWILFAAVAILAIVVVQHGRSRGTMLRQYRYLLVAVLTGLVLPAAISTGVRVIGVQHAVLMQLTVSTIVFFAVFTGYALVRFNALDVDRFTVNVLAYTVTLASVALVFGAVLLGLVLAADGTRLASYPPLLVVLTASVTFAARPLHDAMRSRLDRVYHRDTAAAMEALPMIAQKIQAARGEEEALRAALEGLQGLQPDGMRVWRRDEDRWIDRGGSELAPGSALARWLVAGPVAGLTGIAPVALPPDAEAEAAASEAALVVPVRTRERTSGAIGLGRKRSGLAYTPREAAFATAIAQQLAFRLETPASSETHLGKYRIAKRLGVGGAAEVFLAFHQGPGGFERKVALKRPLPGYYDDQAQPGDAFFEEARLLAGLQHPHIAQVFDAGIEDGAPYISMEYVDGPPLRLLIRLAPTPSLDVLAGIGDALLQALEYAHERTDASGRKRRLVHRDVTPGNILVSRDGEVKLLDFGIAISDDGRFYRTQAGLVRGTPAYMSPEHAHGLEVDRRTDLYAAAIVLFELATGEKAFPHGHSGSAVLPSTSLPLRVEKVLRKGAAPRRADRFDDAGEFRRALLAAIEPEKPASKEAIALWVASCQTIEAESRPELRTESRTIAAPAEATKTRLS